ncbi:MAG: winged helix-turn-helix domain-containing protein [Alphaproteobacteria bacterium]|nr:winged helix-turn-helix domain-containing protein [Alphaproteobacteria bacterium]
MTQAAAPNRSESPKLPVPEVAAAEVLVLVSHDKLRTSLCEMISVWRDCRCVGKAGLEPEDDPSSFKAIVVEAENQTATSQLQRLKAATKGRRVIYFSASSRADLAAWVHLPVPINRFQLLAALDLAFSLSPEIEEVLWSIGRWQFKASLRLLTATDSGAEVRLTEKESAILELLLSHGEGLLSRETLYNRLWGRAANVTEHTMDSHLYRLRRKLGEMGIELVSGELGYGLVY